MPLDIKKEQLVELAKEEGAYQRIEVKGEVLISGWRNCKERWEIIKPYIKNHQSVIDFGSHYGYFANQIAQEYPNTLVWSIEGGEKRAKIQKQMLGLNEVKNVVLSQYQMGVSNWCSLVRVSEVFDTILSLSVLHYFSEEEIENILYCFSQLAPNLIIEFPSKKEEKTAEKNIVQKVDIERLLNKFFVSNVEEIGESSSPADDGVKRKIYLAQNFSIIRQGQSHLYGGRWVSIIFQNANWHKHSTYEGWRFLSPAVNLCTLLKFNPIFPWREDLLKGAAEEYLKIIKERNYLVTDVRVWNVLFTAGGFRVIDFTERVGEAVYGFPSWKKYVRHLKLALQTQRDVELYLLEQLK